MQKTAVSNQNQTKRIIRVGAPAKYETPEQMQAKIDEYFLNEIGKRPFLNEKGEGVKDSSGNFVYEILPPTVSGLALFLGFSDRHGLYDNEKRDGFSSTIKTAITRVENFAEKQLLTKDKPTGAIFWLKNHKWYDRQELTGVDGGPVNLVIKHFDGAKE